jgi:hypothetical protein
MKFCHAAAICIVISLLCWCAQAADSEPVGVVVSCSCHDLVGSRFCFALKEKIRASAGYELVADSHRIAAGMHIICADTAVGEMVGYGSAVSITFTVIDKPGEEYLDTGLVMVGSERVNAMVASTLADFDKDIEPFRDVLEKAQAIKPEPR